MASFESLCLAPSLLPVLPARKRDCSSHPSAGPFPPTPSSKKGFFGDTGAMELGLANSLLLF